MALAARLLASFFLVISTAGCVVGNGDVGAAESQGAPPLDVKLWTQDAKGRFREPAGTMKFVYGTIRSKTSEVRAGWMAYAALSVSSGCP